MKPGKHYSRRLLPFLLLAAAMLHTACTVDSGKKKPPAPVPPVTLRPKPVYYQQDAKTFAFVKANAEKGDAQAQSILSVRYERGEGCEKNEVQALYWLEKSAAQGFAPAQTMLALKYLRGHLVETNPAIAATLLEKAAVQEYTHAEYMLGNLYREGKGVPRDPQRAVFWYSRAAESGYAPARQMLSSWDPNAPVPEDGTPVEESPADVTDIPDITGTSDTAADDAAAVQLFAVTPQE